MKRIGLVLGLLVAIAAPTFAAAGTVREARRAIQARYEQFDRAYMKKDFVGVGDVFDPACTLQGTGETKVPMKAERLVRNMKVMSSRLTVTRAKTRIVSIKSVGDAYEVSAVWTGHSTYTPPAGSVDDPPRSGDTEQTVTDTWKKSPQGWHIVKRVIQRVDD